MRGGGPMVPIGKNYIYIDGHIYKEIKPNGLKDPRWKIIDKNGIRRWITKKQIEALIDKRKEK